MPNNIATESVIRQSKAYMAVLDAKRELYAAEQALRDAEKSRLRPGTPLTAVVDGVAVTSVKPARDEWEYRTSTLVGE